MNYQLIKNTIQKYGQHESNEMKQFYKSVLILIDYNFNKLENTINDHEVYEYFNTTDNKITVSSSINLIEYNITNNLSWLNIHSSDYWRDKAKFKCINDNRFIKMIYSIEITKTNIILSINVYNDFDKLNEYLLLSLHNSKDDDISEVYELKNYIQKCPFVTPDDFKKFVTDTDIDILDELKHTYIFTFKFSSVFNFIKTHYHDFVKCDNKYIVFKNCDKDGILDPSWTDIRYFYSLNAMNNKITFVRT